MPDPSAAKLLADAGGWAAFLFLAGLIVIGWARQWFVHGDLYRSEKARNEKLVGELERNTGALSRLQRHLAIMPGLRDEIEALRTEMALERRRRDRHPGTDADA